MKRLFIYHWHVPSKQCEKCGARGTKTIYMKFKTPDGEDTMRGIGYLCLNCGHIHIDEEYSPMGRR